MPIYEYRCTGCGHELEKIQKMSDDPLTDCPACGQAALKKLISAAAFRLKGGGWYETDFKKDGKRNLAGESESGTSGSSSETKSESSPESRAGASSDSKTESKSEPKSGTKDSGGSDAKKSGSTDKAA